MEDFTLIGNDIIGLYHYRVKCGRAKKEGVVIDVDNGNKRYNINVDGSFVSQEFPAICDVFDELLGEILDIKYAHRDQQQKLRS